MSKYKITIKNDDVFLSDENFIYNVYYYFDSIKEYNKRYVASRQLIGCSINFMPKHIYNKLIKIGIKLLKNKKD